MKRKKFLQLSTIAVTGSILAPQWACKPQNEQTFPMLPTERKNWAGNYTYKAKELHEPASVAELQELVKKLSQQKALGSRHCFNDIADSPGHQISTRLLNKVVEIDGENKILTVEAGSRYGDFSEELYKQGYALPNLASLPHITVAGACATGTHGSGVKNGNLATPVIGVELVKPDGSLAQIDDNHPDFNAIVVGLGAFGVVTKVSLRLEPAFDVRQYVFLDLPMASLKENFEEIMSAGYSVSLFTDWMGGKVSEVWVKQKVEPDMMEMGSEFFGATAASQNMHPIASLSAEACSDQMGVPGPWYERLPHFKMGFTPSAGEELQSEYFIPIENAVEAMLELEQIRNEIYPHLLISEIRTIAADDFWLSPCYQRDSVAIHCTWKQKTPEVMAVLPKIENILAKYNCRPHWAKLFTIDPKLLKERYPRMEDFRKLADVYDPEGKFRNHYLNLNVFNG